MKKSIKTVEIVRLFDTLNKAGYSRLSDNDRIKVWKTMRTMKPVVMKYDEDKKAASNDLMPQGDFILRYQKAQDYEKAEDKSTAKMTQEEYADFIKEFTSFANLVNKAIKELGNITAEIDVYPLDEEGFSRLMASNDWTMEQVLLIDDFITEN